MLRRELLDKVQELNFWYKKQEVGIKREELDEVLKFVSDKKTALAIAGARRAGKTFLSRQILDSMLKEIKENQTLFINFEDPSLEPYLNTESLQDLYETYRYFLNKKDFAFVVLDEVQNLPNWEKWVRIMMEKGENAKFIITGSSSKIFKGETRVLTGRTINFFLLPLSFKNFLEFKGYKIKKYESYSSLGMLLNEYLEYGGFPLIALTEKEKSAYLKELFDDIVIKDIIIKYKLRELDIRKLAVLLCGNFSSLVSVKRLKNLVQNIAKIKISPTSVNKYLYYFEDSFLFFFLPIFSYKIREVMQYPRKAYCIDTGLINTINLRFSEDMGRLYENVAAIELLRRNGKENLFYWKSQKYEVDFVVKEGQKIRQLIQVCYDIRAAEDREVKALIEAGKELRCKNLLVITENYETEKAAERNKIKFVPLWKWLLVF
jgi:hypothetical protein